MGNSNQQTFGNIETLYNTTMGSTLSQLNSQVDLLTPNFQTLSLDNSNNLQNHNNNSYNKDLVLLSKDADLLTRKANLIANLTGDFSLQGSSAKTFYYNPNNTYSSATLANSYSKTKPTNIRFGFFQN